MRIVPAVLAVVLASAVLAPVEAQAPPTHQAFQFKFGGFFPTGGGDFWDENEQVFGLDASDLHDFSFGMSFVLALNNNTELGFNVDFYDATERSQYRDFVDEDGFPILHDTHLELVPFTADLRFLPGGRFNYRGAMGQRRLLKPVPYFGMGIGLTFWEYEEVGDFLDFGFDPPEIFPAGFQDDGVAFTANALAGVEIPINPVVNFLFEGKYLWAEDDLGGDFGGLGELDMSGFYVYGGIAFRF
jgi:hypothetical protein